MSKQTFDLFCDGNKLIPCLLVANDIGTLGPARRANERGDKPGHVEGVREHDGRVARARDRRCVVRHIDGEDKRILEVGFDSRHAVVVQEDAVRDKAVF